MALNLTTELEAVNLMLSVIGESPVNSAEVGDNVDAVLAQQILQETNMEVQSEGWHWNSYTNYKLQPTSDGTIYVPGKVLSLDAIDPQLDIIRVEGKLYDRRKNSFSFPASILVNVTWLFEFADLPQVARHYINVRAARKFQDRLVGSQTLSGFNREDELRALITLQNYEANIGDYNLSRDSWDVGRILARNGNPRW